LPVNRQNILPPFLGHWFVVVEEKGEWFFHRGQYGFCCLECQSIFIRLRKFPIQKLGHRHSGQHDTTPLW
jgi:hypothetical protein